ncbi:MAG: pyrroline-5-carboxylate reductase, partial [Moorea sp. SIO3I7]|nr:pyrroline-5-carboxylate reductase [Moorena sp. SIO3I7]
TTIAAIAKLEKAGFRSALIEAVLGSYQRSRELGG